MSYIGIVNSIKLARTLLKTIIPWSEQELQEALAYDYKKLKEDKQNTIFSLEKIEKELRIIIDANKDKEHFVKAKVVINKDFICHADIYFYFSDEDKWKKSVIDFNKKVVLDDEYREKLEMAPPLEIDFTI